MFILAFLSEYLLDFFCIIRERGRDSWDPSDPCVGPYVYKAFYFVQPTNKIKYGLFLNPFKSLSDNLHIPFSAQWTLVGVSGVPGARPLQSPGNIFSDPRPHFRHRPTFRPRSNFRPRPSAHPRPSERDVCSDPDQTTFFAQWTPVGVSGVRPLQLYLWVRLTFGRLKGVGPLGPLRPLQGSVGHKKKSSKKVIQKSHSKKSLKKVTQKSHSKKSLKKVTQKSH